MRVSAVGAPIHEVKYMTLFNVFKKTNWVLIKTTKLKKALPDCIITNLYINQISKIVCFHVIVFLPLLLELYRFSTSVEPLMSSRNNQASKSSVCFRKWHWCQHSRYIFPTCPWYQKMSLRKENVSHDAFPHAKNRQWMDRLNDERVCGKYYKLLKFPLLAGEHF